MKSVGKIIVDSADDFIKIFSGPYPVGHSDLSEIDGSKAHGDFYHGDKHSDFLKFLKSERNIFFFPNLHLPFISPLCLSKFVVSHHIWLNGIKDFDATFTTSDGKKITKEYQMAETSPYEYFWQEFPIDIPNVVSCDFHVISSLDGKNNWINLHGIRFLIDKERQSEIDRIKAQEEHELATIEKLSISPWF
ncbi:hypothetical protein ADUPG1_011047 [Aduncisulcus paluster]|uniref:Uncharacterized protein n=1 Tax=Aduncisulcus paluster TaxID=2918883 RepID=A0ABQ5JXI3_9EUKA|nr:hypothetical protein ADUPG1_011047 [Aduncisulcus paluster]